MGSAVGPQRYSVLLIRYRCMLAESEELHIERFTLAVALNNEEQEEEAEEEAQGEEELEL